MQTNDFFFGDIYFDEKTRVKSISLHDANALGALCGPTHFTAQMSTLKRILEHGMTE